MPFIGVIAKESDSNFIKNEVVKNSKKNKFEFININRKSIENVKNIKFETIVINDDFSNLLKDSYYLENIIRQCKYLIINSDIIKNVEFLNNDKIKIITYGLNQNAIVTISSTENENMLICIQQDIKNYKGRIIEQQEKSVEIFKSNLKKVCNSLAIFSILIIYDENLEKI